METIVRRTYKFRLYPNATQRERIDWTLERCRLLYNRLLGERQADYKQYGKNTTYLQQQATLPTRKVATPELKNIYAQVLQDVVRRVDLAYQAFFRRFKNGEIPGHPRFKGANRYDSFTYPQKWKGFWLSDDGRHLKLTKIGDVRIKMHRQPKGIIKQCTIRRQNGKYYACLSCEVEAGMLTPSSNMAGVDVGLKYLAATSDGDTFTPAQSYRRREQRLKLLSRKASRKKKGSRRQRKAYRQLAKLHERIANERRDYAHKISKALVDRYELIAFEDLRITNMVKNKHLAKSIHDAGWAQLIQFTTYKAEEAGRRVVLVDPRHTSQECSGCGEIVPKTLAVRTHRCHACGLELDRDINAAKNILARAVPVQSGEVAIRDEVRSLIDAS